MTKTTQAAYNEILEAVASNQYFLIPAFFSHFHGRAATSAAFRLANQNGIIEVAYYSDGQRPVYQASGTATAISEAVTATKN